MSGKPKILRIINRFNLGGPTYNAANLTKYLSDDFETLLIGGEKMESEASSEHILKNAGVEYRILSSMRRSVNPLSDLSAYREISRTIKDFRPDIVHTHASKAGALGRMAASRMNVPVIVHTFHGHVFNHYFSPFKTNLVIGFERYLAKRSTAIVAISKKQRVELAEQYKIADPTKIYTISLGFELEKFAENTDEKRKSFREELGLKEDEIIVSIIGRLVPIKNHQLFFEAVKRLLDEGLKFKAVVVGGGELEDVLKAKVASMDLSDSIVFTSWMHDIDRVVAGSDIVALSSLSEGTPVSLIEAQAGGKAVLSTRVGGVEDILLEGESGLLSENNDLDDFTEKLSLLLRDQKGRDEMGAKGRAFSMQHFGAKRLAADMKKLYIDLLNQTNKGNF